MFAFSGINLCRLTYAHGRTDTDTHTPTHTKLTAKVYVRLTAIP